MLQHSQRPDLNDLVVLVLLYCLVSGNLIKEIAGDLCWWGCHSPTMMSGFLVSASLAFLFWGFLLCLGFWFFWGGFFLIILTITAHLLSVFYALGHSLYVAGDHKTDILAQHFHVLHVFFPAPRWWFCAGESCGLHWLCWAAKQQLTGAALSVSAPSQPQPGNPCTQ